MLYIKTNKAQFFKAVYRTPMEYINDIGYAEYWLYGDKGKIVKRDGKETYWLSNDTYIKANTWLNQGVAYELMRYHAGQACPVYAVASTHYANKSQPFSGVWSYYAAFKELQKSGFNKPAKLLWSCLSATIKALSVIEWCKKFGDDQYTVPEYANMSGVSERTVKQVLNWY